ncbi:hypothetical protein AMECASPLE_036490 [Ameca splendens]|uniref:Uncharacterized protein n=1 Tax=Ameca splendens TaxID=208324 RepID=A0ABV0Z5X1_9TELE
MNSVIIIYETNFPYFCFFLFLIHPCYHFYFPFCLRVLPASHPTAAPTPPPTLATTAEADAERPAAPAENPHIINSFVQMIKQQRSFDECSMKCIKCSMQHLKYKLPLSLNGVTIKK